MYAADHIERGTLTIAEQRALFRRGLEEELAEATRHVTALKRRDVDEASYSKIAVAAYRIVASVPHDAPEITSAHIKPYIDESWTAIERQLLKTMLSIHITPMTVSRSHAVDALEPLGTPINDGTTAEARWNLIRGRIEAHERAALVDHPLFADCDVPAHYLLDDQLVRQARRVVPIAAPSVVSSAVEPSTPMPPPPCLG